MSAPRSAPRDCPVCGERLAQTRLSCHSCGTELSGDFASCDFCALGPEDRETLRVFLQSRGNMKELERHLGVSYPTARGRFDALLQKLGITPGPETRPRPPLSVLSQLARGEIGIDEALTELH
ncbi:MAG: DUF2089 domain-containing protein [Candidatus Dormibacteraceae bacterium]